MYLEGNGWRLCLPFKALCPGLVVQVVGAKGAAAIIKAAEAIRTNEVGLDA